MVTYEYEPAITLNIWGVPEMGVLPKSSVLMGCSLRKHPFLGTPIYGNLHIEYLYISTLDPSQLAREKPQQTPPRIHAGGFTVIFTNNHGGFMIPWKFPKS